MATEGDEKAKAKAKAKQHIPRYQRFNTPEFKESKRLAREYYFNIYLPNKQLYESCNGSIGEDTFRDLLAKYKVKKKQEEEMRLASRKRIEQIIYSSDEEDDEEIKKKLKK